MSVTKNNHTHRKHTKLAKPTWGEFGKNELSILGTTCTEIKRLAWDLIGQLSPNYNVGYVDADHPASGEASSAGNDSAIPAGVELLHTKTQSGERFEFRKKLNRYQTTSFFNDQDVIFVNGNHFAARSQIVVIDPRKSLEKKLDQLTDLKAIILQEGVTEIPSLVKEEIKGIDQIPVFKINQIEEIAGCINRFLNHSTSTLAGLVLAGGKSTRMHTDKTLLSYHGKPQREHLYELLKGYCEQVFLSCRQDQIDELFGNFNIIPDTFLGLGPMGALLSAFRSHPDRAWLVLACDLPLLSRESLQFLIDNRNPSKIATAFRNPESAFPEPLITIWEPKSYQILLNSLRMGSSCPRKILINSDIELLEAPAAGELKNVNRPEEYEEVMEILTDG